MALGGGFLSKPLQLPKGFDKLVGDFEAREQRWAQRLPRGALERLPKRTQRHDDSGTAYYTLAYLAFRAGRFARSRHYFDLKEQHDRRHRQDPDLEDYERQSYAEAIDEAGWVKGDWESFERYVALSPPEFDNALVEGHVGLYVDWAILGKRVGADLVLADLEPAAERTRRVLEEFAKPPVLGVVQSLAVDDGLAKAYFWLERYRRCREASDRFLAALGAWKAVETKPRNVQLGRLAPQRELVSALRLLAGDSEAELRSAAPSRHLVNYLVSKRKEPASYLFDDSLLLLIAIAAADRDHDHVAGFLGAFPHLGHLVNRRRT